MGTCMVWLTRIDYYYDGHVHGPAGRGPGKPYRRHMCMYMQNLLRSLLKGSASADQHHDDTAATLIQTKSFEPNDLPTGLARYGPPCYSSQRLALLSIPGGRFPIFRRELPRGAWAKQTSRCVG
jgi:hypothetical protein